MQILTSEEAAIASSLVTLYYGIVYERKISSTSILFNSMNFFIILASVNLPISVFLALLTYTFAGFIIVKMKLRRIFTFFSTKSFGSLMFVIIFGSNGYFFGIYNVESVLISWVIVALIVYAIYFIVKK
ncbi:MAG: hypothetical protein ACP5F1_03350 [Thermoplasmata archaeon]|nr:hypothetical protein [Thermoplasmata archaeon]